MSEWIESPLEKLADISSGGTPSRANPSFWNGHIPWVTPTDITACQTNYLFDTRDTVTEIGISSSSAKLLPEGTLLLTSRATIGELKIAARPLTTNQGFKNLVPRPLVDGNFLFYQLSLNKAKFERYAAGSTFLEINRRDVGRVAISLPRSVEVQQKIARILGTIDQAIEKTQVLIDKFQQIKAGLMLDLFTRGIGSDGQLRPPREQAPELYQETPIGWIPKEWRADRLEHVLAPVANNLRSGPFGSALLKAELVEDGIPFLGIDNIHAELFVDNFRRFVSEKKFLELNKYAVRKKDVIITIMGTVGRSAIFPDHLDRALSSKHLWTMTLDQERIVPELVCWQLNCAPWVKSWFRRETQGGIMDAIQSRTLKTLTLPVPPLVEQLEITKRHSSISDRIRLEEQTLEKLKKQKSGLMYDLLTGEVPVSVESREERVVETV